MSTSASGSARGARKQAMQYGNKCCLAENCTVFTPHHAHERVGVGQVQVGLKEVLQAGHVLQRKAMLGNDDGERGSMAGVPRRRCSGTRTPAVQISPCSATVDGGQLGKPQLAHWFHHHHNGWQSGSRNASRLPHMPVAVVLESVHLQQSRPPLKKLQQLAIHHSSLTCQ